MADRLVVGQQPVGMLLSPDGDTTAVLREGSDVAVLARQGGWTRVRLEGWIWEPSTLPPDSATGDVLTLEVLRANPAQFAGRRVDADSREVHPLLPPRAGGRGWLRRRRDDPETLGMAPVQVAAGLNSDALPGAAPRRVGANPPLLADSRFALLRKG